MSLSSFLPHTCDLHSSGPSSAFQNCRKCNWHACINYVFLFFGILMLWYLGALLTQEGLSFPGLADSYVPIICKPANPKHIPRTTICTGFPYSGPLFPCPKHARPGTSHLSTASPPRSLVKLFKLDNSKPACSASPAPSWGNHNRGSFLPMSPLCCASWLALVLSHVSLHAMPPVSRDLWVTEFFLHDSPSQVCVSYPTWLKHIPALLKQYTLKECHLAWHIARSHKISKVISAPVLQLADKAIIDTVWLFLQDPRIP